MAIKSRFKEIVGTEQTIIKDADYFKLTFTPQQIIERRETHLLYRELSIFTKYRKPNNILLKGFPGSGKTVTVNFIIKELKNLNEDIDVRYVNCESRSSPDILKILNNKNAKGNFNFFLKQFLDSINKDILIILDEIDRSNKIENLLFHLSRPTESKEDFKYNISLILITNNTRWEDNLNESTRSSLQIKSIIFNPYNENEIKRIIKDRIKNGFKNENAISEEFIDFISKQIAREKKGDCRIAIETIFYSAQLAESKNRIIISKEDIEKSLKISINELNRTLVNKLKDNQLLTLFVVSHFEFKTIEDIHKHYINRIKEDKLNIEPINKTMIFNIINYLVDLCLIKKEIVGKIEKGIPIKRTEISTIIDKELIIDELIMRDLKLSKRTT